MAKTPEPPRCPSCDEEDVKTEVVLVEHGYHISPVIWDDAVMDWTTIPAEWLRSWDCTETYWQCDTCFWQGGDPIGLEPEDDEG